MDINGYINGYAKHSNHFYLPSHSATQLESMSLEAHVVLLELSPLSVYMLVTIASFDFLLEANIAKSRLEVAGIPAYIYNGHTIHTNWLWSNAIGGICLKVHEQSAESALQILKQDNSDLLDQEEFFNSVVLKPENPYAEEAQSFNHQDVYFLFKTKIVFLSKLAVVFSLVYFFLRSVQDDAYAGLMAILITCAVFGYNWRRKKQKLVHVKEKGEYVYPSIIVRIAFIPLYQLLPLMVVGIVLSVIPKNMPIFVLLLLIVWAWFIIMISRWCVQGRLYGCRKKLKKIF